MVRTSVMFDEELAGRLRREARRRNVSLAEVVREAVDAHLPKREPGTPMAFFAVGEGGIDDAERIDELLGEIYEERARRR